MILKNFKTSIRSLGKNKAINGINIIGLSIGIAAIIVIAQYILFENSYDSFFKNNDRIHRLVFYRYYSTGLDKSVGNNYSVGEIAHNNIPEIENFLRCKKSTQFLEVNNEIFKEDRTFFADSSFFDIFSHPAVAGAKSGFLRSPDVAVITESTARKYFGNEDPIGKTIYQVNPGKKALTVQGVVKDAPPNSHLKFDVVISLSTITDKSYCYGCNNTNTYFLLREGSDPKKVSAKITDLAYDYLSSKDISLDFPIEYHLQNLRDIHLHSNYRFEHEANGNYLYQLALLIVAMFILLSAWLNYSNIYNSLIKKKTRNFGIRKINGGSWRSFASDFIFETIITGFISLILAFILLVISFNSLKDYLHLDYSLKWIINYRTILFSILFIVGISVIVGILMSLQFLKTKPLLLIQDKINEKGKGRQKNLVLVVQFSIAVFLIASTLVAVKQIRYMKFTALSMDMEQVLTVKRPFDGKFNQPQKEFEANLRKIPGVVETTYSTITPGEKNGWVKGGIGIKGVDKKSDQFYQSSIAPDFFDFFDVKLLAGRMFYPNESNWTGNSRHVILNKQAALALGYSDFNEIIGKTLYDSDEKGDMGEIIGVVDGYFQNSLDQEIIPTVFNPDQYGYFMFIKVQGINPVDLVSQVKSEYQKSFKESYFEYFFLDDFFNKQYQSHIQFNRCFILFSLMAIIISMLSLLGVVIMGSALRIKEIGIRKVNGAKTTEILALLNRDFIKGVIISILIATPLAWFAMFKWLENFAFKTEITWWIFGISGVAALLIAFLTVSWQSWRAASRNPVEALRYE